MPGENEGANGADGATGGDGASGGTGSTGAEGFKPITYNTQEELNAAFADRATRAANSAKEEALKVFTDAGVSAEDALEAYNAQKAAEDAKKAPETKEAERAAKDRAELARYKAKEARDNLVTEVAKAMKVGDTPIPAELLAGTTKEEMEAHGKSLIAFIEQLAGKSGPRPRPPAYNPNQGYNQQDHVAAGDPIRNLFETGSFQ